MKLNERRAPFYDLRTATQIVWSAIHQNPSGRRALRTCPAMAPNCEPTNHFVDALKSDRRIRRELRRLTETNRDLTLEPALTIFVDAHPDLDILHAGDAQFRRDAAVTVVKALTGDERERNLLSHAINGMQNRPEDAADARAFLSALASVPEAGRFWREIGHKQVVTNQPADPDALADSLLTVLAFSPPLRKELVGEKNETVGMVNSRIELGLDFNAWMDTDHNLVTAFEQPTQTYEIARSI